MATPVPTRRTCLRWPSTVLVLAILVAASPVASSRKLPRTKQPVRWYIPPPQTSFYWQLQGCINMSNTAKVFDFDAFDNSAATIAKLHARGKKVMCYFSVGSFEDWRPDAAKFPNSVLGAKLCATMNDAGTRCLQYWPGERWIDVRSTAVRTIMEGRIKMAAGKGCDGIEPDNVDAYSATTQDPQGQPITKFQITQNDEVAYLTWLSATVHKYNMSIGLKNSGDIASNVLTLFDWALSEECNAFSDYTNTWSAGQYQCDYLNLFIRAGKAAFVTE